MSWIRAWADFLHTPDPRPVAEIDSEILEELRFHIALRTEDNIAAGMAPDVARHDALHRFGDFERVRRACRRIRVGERIMLQRVQILLTTVLLGAVVYLLVAHYNSQRAQQATLAKMTETLERLAVVRSGENAPLETELAAKVAAAPPVVVKTVPESGAVKTDGQPAVPYLLVFETADAAKGVVE